MRLSRFWTLMEDEFGESYAHVLAGGHVLQELGERTVTRALEDGLGPRQVWEALCRDMGVPQERWLGIDRPPMEVPREIANEPPE